MAELHQFYDHVNVLIKPTDGCNLRCLYCFHQDMGYSPKTMETETLSRFLEITLPHYKSISIVWHGGEPTFVGLEKFRGYVALTEAAAEKHGVLLKQSMQTNGTRINEEFLEFLTAHKIAVGVSYDGPVNDRTRGSTKKFMALNSLMEAHDVKFGTIAVISGLNVRQLPELYQHMNRLKRPVQLNHYVVTSPNAPAEMKMTAEQYVTAMQSLFAQYIEDEACRIEVDPFIRMIRDSYLGYSSLCARSSCMRNWFCLEPNGMLTPCDRDFPAEYHYGSVFDLQDIRQIYESAGYLRLMEKAIARRKKCQESCSYYPLCEGGCNNNALYETGLENNGGFSCRVNMGLLSCIGQWAEETGAFTDYSTVKNPVVRQLLHSLKDTPRRK